MQTFRLDQDQSERLMDQPKRVPNPCVGVCALDEHDLCIACRRSGLEIAYWSTYSDDKKRAVWALIREREANPRNP